MRTRHKAVALAAAVSILAFGPAMAFLPYAERYQAALAKLGIEQAGLMSGAGHA